MADDLSIFSLEEQEEQVRKRKEAIVRQREQRKNDEAFYRNLIVRISPAEYGADSKWDRTFGKFPVYVDAPGMGLCVTTRGRWKNYQGKERVHWGVYKINPFVKNDDELRSEYYEIPTDGSVGNVQRTWVMPIPFTLLQFRLDKDKNQKGASELVFCRARDYDDDEFECKVMRLDDFLGQVKADKNHDKGYRVLLDALRMQYPKEVEKYMVLEKRIHGRSEGPAQITHKKRRSKHSRQQTAPYSIIVAPPAPQNEESDDDDEDDASDTVSDLNTVDKRIGWGMGVDNQIAMEEAAAAGSSVNGEEMNFVMRYRMARFIDKNSSACRIQGITQCNACLPQIPHTIEQRLTALSVERSRTAKLLANGGDPSTGRTWSFSLFDV